MIKRIMDVLLASVAIVVLAIPMLLIAVIILLVLGRPIFFFQTRPGRQGSPFRLVKFRTMLRDAKRNEERRPDEQRMTRFGGFLRRSSLDELPELWNVLTGDMSLVGPRPLLMEYLPLYTAAQARRHDVRPGITGWAQVNGRDVISWEEKFALDVWYVCNQSLVLDLRILIRTVVKVLRAEAVTQSGRATREKFRGYVPSAQAGTRDVDASPGPPGSEPERTTE